MRSQRQPWMREVLIHVCPLAVKEWYKRAQDAQVFVSAYRVFRVPFLTSGYSRKPLVADFGEVRAVFGVWDAPYQVIDQNVIEGSDGKLGGQFFGHLQRTGGGVLLLLLTPLPDNYNPRDEGVAKERVRFIRSLMVSLIGHNAAYEHEFDMAVECGARTVSAPSPIFTTPVNEMPAVNRKGIDLVNAALESLSSLDHAAQNRIRLALRWYQRSLGDNRVVHDSEEEQVDRFINCWLAWETLAMERYDDINSITRMLAHIHELSVQRTGEIFPVGRINSLRGDILHNGRMGGIKVGLTRFMSDVFADLLLQVLNLPSGGNTRKYLDGTASRLI
jgi:Apea-like HEPN